MTRKLTHGRRVMLFSLLGGLPGLAIAGVLLLRDVRPVLAWTLLLPAAAVWLGFAWAVYVKVVRPLQSLALNWGYRRALGNPLPGWPIPGGDRGASGLLVGGHAAADPWRLPAAG